MKKSFLVAVLAAGLVEAVSAQALVPGWLTDPTNVKNSFDVVESYQTPEKFKYPYISTYYVKPTVLTEEDVKIGFFVTDFESSKIRFLDDSHRFTVSLEYRLNTPGARSKILTLKDVKSGDGEFVVGKLPVGDYEMRVWAKDAKGRESHRVIQDFRVRTKESLTIPDAKVYKMTEADLASYDIQNDDKLEKIVYVSSNKTEVVKDKRTDVPGYTVNVPLDSNGKVPYRAYEKVTVDYDEGYDHELVETNAVKTLLGLQKLVDDKAAAGFRKLVLLPGTYRISHIAPVSVPDGFTLDLGTATLKLNSFTGERGLMAIISSAVDAHVVNGTLEGDYWTHDYKNSPKDSEWVSGFEIGGDSWYSSFENVKVVDVTGYGGQNGIRTDKKGGLAFLYESLPKFGAGGLDPKTGLVDPKDTYRFTTDYKDLKKITGEKGRRRLQISKYLGYQGVRTHAWQMTVAWYDHMKTFISAETSWQYREMWIPENAAYMRVSVQADSAEAADKSELVITGFRIPINCAVRNCTFDHCRCVGYAASQMRNMLFEGNFFTRSGEAEAKCAFDAEDGADQMQDVYLLRNKFRDNPINNSILTCSGHNFILEKNDCSVHFWGRTHSPCVRDNDIEKGEYWCDSRMRSGYGRFENNRYSKSIKIGQNEMKSRPDSWDYVLSKLEFDGSQNEMHFGVGPAGRVVGCTFRNFRSIGLTTAYACVLENCKGWCTNVKWSEVNTKDCAFKGFWGENKYTNCRFENMRFDSMDRSTFVAKKCQFKGCSLGGFNAPKVSMIGCDFENSAFEGGWVWECPATMLFKDCKIKTRDNIAFLSPGVYAIGKFGFDNCTISGEKPLIHIKDLRPHGEKDLAKNPDREPGAIAFRNVYWKGESRTVVSHGTGAHEKQISTKEIGFFDKGGNTWPGGTEIVTDLLPSWTLKKNKKIKK